MPKISRTSAARSSFQPQEDSEGGMREPHNGDGGQSIKQQRIVKTPYTKRACICCHKAKVKCSHERPCHRCITKGVECVDYIPLQQQQQAIDVVVNNMMMMMTQQQNILIPSGLNQFLFCGNDGNTNNNHSSNTVIPLIPVSLVPTYHDVFMDQQQQQQSIQQQQQQQSIQQQQQQQSSTNSSNVT